MAYDTARRRVVRFGGLVSAYEYDDIWEFAPVFPADYLPFGSGCEGSAGTPSLSPPAGALPWTGEVFALEVTNVPAGQPVWLLLGESNTEWGSAPLPYSLAWLGMPTCELSVSPDVSVPLIVQGGTATGLISVPNVASLLGESIYVPGARQRSRLQSGRTDDLGRRAADVRRQVAGTAYASRAASPDAGSLSASTIGGGSPPTTAPSGMRAK